jgi:hypothetical protein
MEYAVYSDESYISAERYRSIGAVSFPVEAEPGIKTSLSEILARSNVSEFKWSKLKDAKYRFCAEALVHFICENLILKDMRIDVLIWDTQDSRHKIQGRDDTANFERMFFHLMKNLMTRRENDSDWRMYPDQRFDIDWMTVQDCLSAAGNWRKYFESRLFEDAFSDQFYHIRRFKQVDSKSEPCCQIADFFSGIAVFSKNNYELYRQWCDLHDDQLCLFGQPDEVELTGRQEARFEILNLFIKNCRSRKLGVSIDYKKCLCTFNPNNPINFWHYVPQRPEDKAPVRGTL